MKKTITILLVILLAICTATAEEGYHIENDNTANFQMLLSDLLSAWENPGTHSFEADIEAIRNVSEIDGEIASSIAETWEKVYLDPDYTLNLYAGGERVDALEQTAIPDSSDHAFVVLGYELKDGEMTEELKGRCDAASVAANSFPDAIIVCSGGATGENNPEQHTEAGLMKDYLMTKRGIDADRILIDERAMSTVDNAINTFDILRENGIKTMTIITSSYHQRRGQVLYNAVAVLYRQSQGYSPEIVENYCLDIEPENDRLRNDASIAVRQLGAILGLPEQ